MSLELLLFDMNLMTYQNEYKCQGHYSLCGSESKKAPKCLLYYHINMLPVVNQVRQSF